MSSMAICHICAIPYGYGTTEFRQKCQCRRSGDEERWSETCGPCGSHQLVFDFNEHTTLCYCCLSEKLRSGSKWCVWFCDECKAKIVAFNKWMGATVIPIGRHTIMAGVALKGGSSRSEVRAFVSQMNSLFSRMNDLSEWRKVRFRFNLARLGDVWKGDPDLDAYLQAVRESGDRALAKEAAFVELCRHFEVPDSLFTRFSVTPSGYAGSGRDERG